MIGLYCYNSLCNHEAPSFSDWPGRPEPLDPKAQLMFWSEYPHYLYSVMNSKKNKKEFLSRAIPMYLETLPQSQRGRLSTAELLNHLKAHVARFSTSMAISEFLDPPEPAANLSVFASASVHTFHLTRRGLAEELSKVSKEGDGKYAFQPTNAYHGTGLDRSLLIASSGKMQPGCGNSAGKENVVYFHLSQSNVAFYSVLSYLSNGRCPQYLWNTVIELSVDMHRMEKVGGSQHCAPAEAVHIQSFNIQAIHVDDIFELCGQYLGMGVICATSGRKHYDWFE